MSMRTVNHHGAKMVEKSKRLQNISGSMESGPGAGASLKRGGQREEKTPTHDDDTIAEWIRGLFQVEELRDRRAARSSRWGTASTGISTCKSCPAATRMWDWGPKDEAFNHSGVPAACRPSTPVA